MGYDWGMKYRMQMITILIVLFPYFVPAQASSSLIHYLESVRSEFIGVLYKRYDAFELCEAFSKADDKKVFLNRVFATTLFSEAQQVKSSELFASHENATSRLHLGMVALGFKDRAGAEKIFDYVQSRKRDYFARTKILTRYKAYHLGSVVIFVYSETFMQVELKEFFGVIDKVFPPTSK
jgi:hypothetical protein